MARRNREERVYISRSALTNGWANALIAVAYLTTVFVLELYPGVHVFGISRWRGPFLLLCVLTWPVLVFGAIAHCSARVAAKKSSSSGYVSLPKSVRPFVVFIFFWVAVGLFATATGGAFVFLALRESAIGFGALQEWVIPLFTGIVPAVITAWMGLALIISGITAARGKKAPRSSSKRRTEGSTSADGLTTAPAASTTQEMSTSNVGGFAASDVEAGRVPDGTLGGSEDYSQATPSSPYAVPHRPPAYSPSFIRGDEYMPQGNAGEPRRDALEELLAQLNAMGFPNRSQNLAALQAASYDVSMAAQRLVDVQNG